MLFDFFTLSKKKLSSIAEQLANLEEQKLALSTRWSQEKEMIQKIRDAKAETEQLRTDAERMEREGLYDKVAEIRYGSIPALEQAVEESNNQLVEFQKGGALLKEEIDSEDIIFGGIPNGLQHNSLHWPVPTATSGSHPDNETGTQARRSVDRTLR